MPPAFSTRAPFTRALFLVLGCTLLGSAPPTIHAAPGDPVELADLCRVDGLPQDIRGSLTRNFAAWKIQEPSDLSTRARTRWGAERPLACPGIAAGHFQDPKNASYALLLIPADHSSSAYRLVIYTQQTGQQYYGFKAVGQTDSGAGDVFIQAVPTVKFFEATSKLVAHSKVSEAVMVSDSAATEAYLYIYADMSYNREPVTYQ